MNTQKLCETREFYALKELMLLNARMVASCTKALKQAGAFDNPKDVDVVLDQQTRAIEILKNLR